MIKQKHAFLIISHNEFRVLQRLIDLLDHERTDIYVHIDKKVKDLPSLHANVSVLYVLKDRIDVRWGHYSQIACEMLLFETALKNGPYEHYHVLSGTHLPLKPIEALFQYYEIHHNEEIMEIWSKCTGKNNIKLGKWNFCLRHYKSSNTFVRMLAQSFWRWNLAIQKRLPIYRLPGGHYVKSSNWVSITQEAVDYLVNQKEHIRQKYRYSFCGDEYFVATELTKAGFEIYDEKKLLFQIWEGESAKVLTEEETESAKLSDKLYARKFSDKMII